MCLTCVSEWYTIYQSNQNFVLHRIWKCFYSYTIDGQQSIDLPSGSDQGRLLLNHFNMLN